MKDLGDVRKLLDIRVRIENGMIKLDQREYIEKLLRKFGMLNCNILSTPMDVNCVFVKPNLKTLLPDVPYQEIIE
jgi:hypothetical protein